METVPCIHCEHPIAVPDEVMLAEIITCPDCGAQLEIVNANPMELVIAPEIEEDWGE